MRSEWLQSNGQQNYSRNAIAGNADVGELFPSIYDELKALAGAQFRNQPKNRTLQPTAAASPEEEIEISRTPVQGEWRHARAWHKTQLKEAQDRE